MRYALRQKILSWSDTYEITDGEKRPVFRVEGRVLSWGKKLSFQDAAGKELLFISQRLWSWLPRYEILRGRTPVAEVAKRWSWFKSRFTVREPGEPELAITGDVWQHEYAFERNGRRVAAVSKRFWSWADHYGVDVAEGEDDALVLACVVVVDLCCHGHRD